MEVFLTFLHFLLFRLSILLRCSSLGDRFYGKRISGRAELEILRRIELLSELGAKISLRIVKVTALAVVRSMGEGDALMRTFFLSSSKLTICNHNNILLILISITFLIGKVNAFNPNFNWCSRWLERNLFVHRIGTKDAKKLKKDPEVEKRYFARVALFIKDHNIPPELVFFWDEYGQELL